MSARPAWNITPRVNPDASVTFTTELGENTVHGVLKELPDVSLRLKPLEGDKDVSLSLAHVERYLRARYTSPPGRRQGEAATDRAALGLALRNQQHYTAWETAEEAKGGHCESVRLFGGTLTALIGLGEGRLILDSPALGEVSVDFGSVTAFEVLPWVVTRLAWPEGALKLLVGKAALEISDLGAIEALTVMDPENDTVSITLNAGDRLIGKVTQWPEAPLTLTVAGKERKLTVREIAKIEQVQQTGQRRMAPGGGRGFGGSSFGGLGFGGGLGGGFGGF